MRGLHGPASYDQKPYRKAMIETCGATVHRQPSELTQAGRTDPRGRSRHARQPWHRHLRGGRGGGTDDDTNYSLGSVLNHVLMHQTVIGEEALKQLALVEEYPDVIIGCAGGGSNFAGFTFPFVREKLAGKHGPRDSCRRAGGVPHADPGQLQFDFGDTVGMTPLVKMHTLGHDFVPDPIHAGGLRYHGMAPLVSLLKEEGIIEAESLHQTEAFGRPCSSPGPRGSSLRPSPPMPWRSAMMEAEEAKEAGEEKVIVFNLSGHGHFDMAAYEEYLEGTWLTWSTPRKR